MMCVLNATLSFNGTLSLGMFLYIFGVFHVGHAKFGRPVQSWQNALFAVSAQRLRRKKQALYLNAMALFNHTDPHMKKFPEESAKCDAVLPKIKDGTFRSAVDDLEYGAGQG